MNVEPRPHRERGEVAKQLLAAGPARVGRDGLRLESLAQGEPPGAGAVVVHFGVHGSLEQVARVRRQVAHPGVEVDDLVGVVRLPELHQAEAVAAQHDLEIKVRRLGAPGLRGVECGATGRGELGRAALRVRASAQRERNGRREDESGYGAHRSSQVMAVACGSGTWATTPDASGVAEDSAARKLRTGQAPSTSYVRRVTHL